MKGVAFQTSVAITAASAVRSSASQAIGRSIRPSRVSRSFTTPKVSSYIQRHSWADTTVGTAQGISTAALSAPRPANRASRTSAIAMPSTSSSDTDATVKTRVLPTERHQSGSASTMAKSSSPTQRAAPRSERRASVKPKATVRSSGQPATAARTASVGSRNSQAARTR